MYLLCVCEGGRGGGGVGSEWSQFTFGLVHDVKTNLGGGGGGVILVLLLSVFC